MITATTQSTKMMSGVVAMGGGGVISGFGGGFYEVVEMVMWLCLDL